MHFAFIDLRSYHLHHFLLVARYLENEMGHKVTFLSDQSNIIAKIQKFGAHVVQSSNYNNGEKLNDHQLLRAIGRKEWMLSKDFRGLKKRSRNHYSRLHAFFCQEEIDSVFVWNGESLFDSLAIYAARQLGLTTLFAENSFIPHTMQLDSAGTDANASIKNRLGELVRQWEPTCDELNQTRQALKNYLERRLVIYPESYPRLKTPLLAGIKRSLVGLFKFSKKYKFWANRKLSHNLSEFPDRYIFFPIQSKVDATQLIHSPVYKNDVDALLYDLLSALGDVDPDIKLIVKPHPDDLHSENYDRWVGVNEQMIWVKSQPVQDLIENACAVITVNSTVGLESLMFNKPTMLLGNAFYDDPSWVVKLSRREEWRNKLSDLLCYQVDQGWNERVMCYLQHCFLVKSNYRDLSDESIKTTSTRMVWLANE